MCFFLARIFLYSSSLHAHFLNNQIFECIFRQIYWFLSVKTHTKWISLCHELNIMLRIFRRSTTVFIHLHLFTTNILSISFWFVVFFSYYEKRSYRVRFTYFIICDVIRIRKIFSPAQHAQKIINVRATSCKIVEFNKYHACVKLNSTQSMNFFFNWRPLLKDKKTIFFKYYFGWKVKTKSAYTDENVKRNSNAIWFSECRQTCDQNQFNPAVRFEKKYTK